MYLVFQPRRRVGNRLNVDQLVLKINWCEFLDQNSDMDNYKIDRISLAI